MFWGVRQRNDSWRCLQSRLCSRSARISQYSNCNPLLPAPLGWLYRPLLLQLSLQWLHELQRNRSFFGTLLEITNAVVFPSSTKIDAGQFIRKVPSSEITSFAAQRTVLHWLIVLVQAKEARIGEYTWKLYQFFGLANPSTITQLLLRKLRANLIPCPNGFLWVHLLFHQLWLYWPSAFAATVASLPT